MKIGNVSQTIVPVPDFYMNEGEKQLETFTLPYKSKPKPSTYFKEADYFKKPLDININHNPRFEIKTAHNKNEEKYIPIYNRGNYPRNVEMKNTIYPSIIDNSKCKTVYPTNGYEKYKDFMKKTDVNKQIEPDLRKDLMNSTIQLLEKINANYDLKRWNEFDTRTNVNRFYQTAYSPITDYINCHKSTKENFMETLNEKAGSLRVVNSRAKENINNFIEKKNKEPKVEPLNQKNVQEYLDKILDQNREGLLRLRYNNQTPFQFNEADQKFLDENEMFAYRTQDTNLYKKLLSPGRMEFDIKKIKPIKKKFNARDIPGLISKDKYSFNENLIYNCQDEMWIRPMHPDAFK